MKEIKNIIFDMGRVLLQFDPFVSLNTYCESEEEKQLIYKELFQGEEWLMADKGLITNGQRYELVKERIPEALHQTLKLVVENWDICMEPVNGALDFFHEIKEKGYHAYVLSNACNRFYSYFPVHYNLKAFDGIVVSSDVKMIKPFPEIYRYLLNTYQLNPDECFFIDDLADNVEAARQLGIHGFIFKGNFGDIRKELRL